MFLKFTITFFLYIYDLHSYSIIFKNILSSLSFLSFPSSSSFTFHLFPHFPFVLFFFPYFPLFFFFSQFASFPQFGLPFPKSAAPVLPHFLLPCAAPVQWRSQGLPEWANCPPGGTNWGRKWAQIEENWDKIKNEEKWGNVPLLPTRGWVSGYAPESLPFCESLWASEPGKYKQGIQNAVNGKLELTLLKGRQRFDTVSTSNLKV